MNMPALSLIFGFLLATLGGVFFVRTGAVAPTALIPAYLGLGIFLCGTVGAIRPQLRMHVMHVAALLGLLGAFGGLGMALKNFQKLLSAHPAAIEQLAMGAICAGFVALCVRSFIAARRARQAATS